MAGTYSKGADQNSTYCPSRKEEYDGPGKETATEFWESLGGSVSINDIRADGEVEKKNADLAVALDNRRILAEAAVKKNDVWHYIYEGIDIETRKKKYFREDFECFVCMTNGPAKKGQNHIQPFSEMLIIPYTAIMKADADCGNEHKGQGSTDTTANFVMPSHGCHRVKKFCRGSEHKGGSVETFLRIPYKYITHYKKSGSTWNVIQQGQKL